MLIKLVEIYEENTNFSNSQITKQFLVREIFINKLMIVSIKEDLLMLDNFVQKKLPKGFAKDQKFSLLTINKGNIGQDLSIVGSPEYIFQLVENFNVNKTQ